ncbi:unnamed protein product, partial [Oikopleura dioica]
IDENRRFAFGGTVSSFLKTPTAEPYFKSRKEDELWRAFVHQDLADTSVDENEEQEQLKMSRFFINDENEKFTLHNHKFVLEKNFITILVQVHDRLDLLKVLLDSLKSVRGIEKSFLVISLDTLIPEIEEYLKNYVTFCKLAIIHHPFSMAFYKGQFPAESPTDCPKDLKVATDVTCNRAAKADKYGHFREVKYSQIKLHWTWKLNFIFSRDEIGTVLLLEEDHFLAEDALWQIENSLIPTIKESKEMIVGTLGTYIKSKQAPTYKTDYLRKGVWISGQHNMGMVVDRAFYDNLKLNAAKYCFYDDYNWDFSLMSLAVEQQWRVLFPVMPRIYHLGGDCGYHSKSHSCNLQAAQEFVRKTISSSNALLFQKLTRVSNTGPTKYPKLKANGG